MSKRALFIVNLKRHISLNLIKSNATITFLCFSVKFVSSFRYKEHCLLQVVSLKRRGDMITNPASYSRGL